MKNERADGIAIENNNDVCMQFNDIKAFVANLGVDFTYEFKDFHDRRIETDIGWEILLSRGIDFFEPRDNLSVEYIASEARSCKAFSVTYCKEK